MAATRPRVWPGLFVLGSTPMLASDSLLPAASASTRTSSAGTPEVATSALLGTFSLPRTGGDLLSALTRRLRPRVEPSRGPSCEGAPPEASCLRFRSAYAAARSAAHCDNARRDSGASRGLCGPTPSFLTEVIPETVCGWGPVCAFISLTATGSADVPDSSLRDSTPRRTCEFCQTPQLRARGARQGQEAEITLPCAREEGSAGVKPRVATINCER